MVEVPASHGAREGDHHHVNEIVIEERGGGLVTVGFGNGGCYETMFAPPLADDPPKLELVRWYFEDHLRYPFLDSDLTEEAIEVLAGYGQSLFEQVFAATPGSRPSTSTPSATGSTTPA